MIRVENVSNRVYLNDYERNTTFNIPLEALGNLNNSAIYQALVVFNDYCSSVRVQMVSLKYQLYQAHTFFTQILLNTFNTELL